MGKTVEESARYALNLRYSLLPLLYTELFKASQDGRPVAKSLSLLWPEDENAFLEDQFLWGDSLMILPILEQGKTEREAYLPKGLWYDFQSLNLLNKDVNDRNGSHIKLSIPIDRIKLAQRGGSILFVQKPELTTFETRKNNFTMYVALDENQSAIGDLYVDEGESIILDNEYSFINAILKSNVLTLDPLLSNYHIKSLVDHIKIIGTNLNVNALFINGKEHPTSNVKNVNSNTIEIQNIAINLNKLNQVVWY